jgi:RluA family pseudouridine synthase
VAAGEDPPIATSHEPSEKDRHLVVVANRLHGILLTDLLHRRWPDVARSALRNLVHQGRVKVNADGTLKPRHRLRGGDVVEISLPGPIDGLKTFRKGRSTADAEIPILHEDDSTIVALKPSGLSAGADRSGQTPGLIDRLAAERSGSELRLVNRPDRDASGCVLLAKDLPSAKRLEQCLAAGEIELDCLALVHGAVRWKERQVDQHLGPDPQRPGRIRTVKPGSKGAREASTHMALDEAFRQYSLVSARPMTSRNHQIRVHLGFLGHPIVADPEYGLRDRLLLSEIKKNYKARAGVVERPLLSRMFLHISRVSFPDSAGVRREVTAPLAKDLEVVLAKLRSFARKDSH